MPRDKTVNHVKIIKAIQEEFLEKGFDAASMRSIATRSEMSAAGLYRHYKDKEAMFTAFISPLLEEINEWFEIHKRNQYERLKQGITSRESFMEDSFAELIRDVIFPRKEVFRVLLEKSGGSAYDNFLHNFVHWQQREMMEALQCMKEYGLQANIPEEEELHTILSAYITAYFEPIIHDYPEEKLNSCLKTINQFFMPGWLNMMGF